MTAIGLRSAAGLALAAVSLAGCGGTGPQSATADSAAVKRTVLRAFADLAKGDGAGFCSLATVAGQATLAKAVPGSTCASVVTLVGDHLSAAQKTGLLHAQISAVTISGDHATVRDASITTTQGTLKGFLNPNGRPTMLTRQSDGSWKISG